MKAIETESNLAEAEIALMPTSALDSIFGVKPKGSIFLPSQPYGIKLNCKSGQILTVDDGFLGEEMEVSIVKVASYFGTLGMTVGEEWMNLLFVPAPGCDILPADTVCSTVIKKRSLSAFHGVVTKLCGDGVNPAKGVFRVGFKGHSGSQGSYFSVAFKWRERQGESELAQLNRIASFMAGGPNLIDGRLASQLVPMDGLTPDEVSLLRASSQALPQDR